MKSMRVSKQLMLLIVMFMAGFILTGMVAFGTLGLVKVNGPIYKGIVQQKDLIADILPPPEYLIEAYLVTLEMVKADEKNLSAWVQKSAKLKEEYETRHRFWIKDLPEGKIKALMVEHSYQPGKAFLDLRDQAFIPALLRGDKAEAERLLPLLARQYQAHRQVIDDLVQLATEQAATEEKQAAEFIATRTGLMAVLSIAVAAGVGLFGWFIVRNLLARLGGEPAYVVEIMRRLADGDLSMEVDTKPGDATSMLVAVKLTQGYLKEIIGRIRAAADKVSGVAIQLSSAAGQIESTAGNEANAASSMAAAVEELTVSIGQIAGHANQAQAISLHSDQLSVLGGEVMQRVVADMEEIATEVVSSSQVINELGQQSDQIFSIVKAIKGIADQTNLLALNAAIEAARAGEQGRGFAVVADEVRGLAGRTAESTQQITGIVESIQAGLRNAVQAMDVAVSRVAAGVSCAKDGGNSITGIKDGARQVVRAVEDISIALREQSNASGEVAENVEKIAAMTEENHAAIQETANTARELERLAQVLREVLSHFTLEANPRSLAQET